MKPHQFFLYPKCIILVIIFYFFVAPTQTSLAQIYTPPDSCLKMIIPNEPQNRIFNPDSVKVDSCLWSCTLGEKYGRFYKLYFDAVYNKYIFNKIIPLNYFLSLDDIDTAQKNAYEPFKYFFENFKPFKIYRSPKLTNDSSFIGVPRFFLDFIKHTCDDSIYFYLSKIYSFGVVESRSLVQIDTDVNEKFNKNNVNINITKNSIEINFENIKNEKQMVYIYNFYGQEVFSINSYDGDALVVNCSKYPNGIYFIRINNSIQKLLIMR